MHRFLVLLFAGSFLVLAACGDDDGPTGTDGGPPVDRDMGGADLGPPSDAGTDPDVGPPVDGGSERDGGAPGVDAAPAEDAGPGEDAGPPPGCTAGLGDFCETEPCGGGLECQVGRCTPQARQLCGGFAGAMCTDPAYPVCLYFTSADFGPCLTREEAACLCARAPEAFVCG